MPKARCAQQALRLTDIPNVGPATAADLCRIGIATPAAVRSMQPQAAFDALCRATGQRHDPCVLDVFLAAYHFMNGGTAQPWWAFTAQRKALLAASKTLDGTTCVAAPHARPGCNPSVQGQDGRFCFDSSI